MKTAAIPAFCFLVLGSACRGGTPSEEQPAPESEPVAAAETAPPPALDMPTLHVQFAPKAPRIDGVLGDEAWRSAKFTRRFINTLDGRRGLVHGQVWAVWDKRFLYVAAKIEDELLRAAGREHDDHLWEQDCIELMLDPDGDGKDYMEIQVSPRGVVFDTKYDTRRRPRPYGHVDWDSGAHAAVSTRGKIDDKEKDAGYTVELALPWKSLGTTPKPDETWRANIYLMDLRADRQVASGWSAPLVSDFHVPARFGHLRFAAPPQDSPTPAAAPKQMKMSTDRAARLRNNDRVNRMNLKERMLKRQAIDRRQPGEPLPEMPDTPSEP